MDAVQNRGALGAAMNAFHTQYDLLITPTLPIAAFEAGREVPEGSGMKRWTEWTPFSYPFNLTQQPAATVPCGFDSAGLPVGLQIVGARYADALVLRAARALESARAFQMPDMNTLPEPQPAEAPAEVVDVAEEVAIDEPAPSAESALSPAPDLTAERKPGGSAAEHRAQDAAAGTGVAAPATPRPAAPADRSGTIARQNGAPADRSGPVSPAVPGTPDNTGKRDRTEDTTVVLPPRKRS